MAERKLESDLDRSIDVGLDQFGRFVKYRWLWLALAILVGWYFLTAVLPQLTPPSPGSILLYALQIMFAIFYALIQFVAIFWFMGRPRLYWVMPGETGLGFKDYKGNPDVLEEARRIVRILTGIKAYQEMGGQPVRGLLLSGPPGTGKSYLAQCISTEAGVPFAYASAASFRGMFWGMDVLMVKNLYRKARRYACEYGACVIFIDEFDAIGMSRTGGGEQNGQSRNGGMGGMFGGGNGGLNELLMQMDPPPIDNGWIKKVLRVLGLFQGRAQVEPVLTIGATNVPQALDAALLRPGRFDRQIRVLPPTDRYRGEVIEYYLNKVSHDPAISLPALVQRMFEYTPVAIKHIINEAVILAHFDGRDLVTYKDIAAAQDKHEFGIRQLSDLTPIERRRLAYHEAGHTVACYYLMEREFPSYVTLHRHDGEQGAEAFAAWRNKETVKTRSKQEVLALLQVYLASRAAEELFLDMNLDGVSGDLSQATTLAGLYVGAYGMDGTFLSRLNSLEIAVPRLAERVEEVLQQQYREVLQLFREHSLAVIALAEALSERDELLADEIKTIIDEADASQVLAEVNGALQAI
ncbi:AAA ATPase central domain protein [Ktedonobacter racemifer DSM 44963]|uniref:AAA ATPase central domain protein n=1 Tax=Ktedonobacter racemifer DSM 44963 TaxID=485913 RepID=D6TGJ6_KTERA|nr:AAA ATPase central domain protein [Ktedonobacter racemifer DSM 44963]